MNYSIFEPKSFEEVSTVADVLMQNSGALVNLHRLDRVTAQRFTDFLTGTVYAMHGKIEMAGTNVIVAVPNETDITGSIEL